jgi:ABC-type oligopeptide transport system ATPase subunit
MGGGYKTKAVHDVSFQIKEGECFGLVGESGCGKTTTGRSIIRLYNITSGSIYYKGYRISGGTRWNEKEIKWSRIHTKEKIKAIEEEEKAQIKLLSVSRREPVDKLKARRGLYKDRFAALKAEKAEELKEKNDPTQDDNDLLLEQVKVTFDKREAALQEEEKKALRRLWPLRRGTKQAKSRGSKTRRARRSRQLRQEEAKRVKEQKAIISSIKYDNSHVNKRLMSEIQMIFQDPVD